MVDTLSEMGILMISWDETVGWWRYLLWRDESVLVSLHIVIIILQRRIGFLGSRVKLGLSVLALPVVQNIMAILSDHSCLGYEVFISKFGTHTILQFFLSADHQFRNLCFPWSYRIPYCVLFPVSSQEFNKVLQVESFLRFNMVKPLNHARPC